MVSGEFPPVRVYSYAAMRIGASQSFGLYCLIGALNNPRRSISAVFVLCCNALLRWPSV